MSMMNGMGRQLPTGETVASFPEYERATKAVSQLIEKEVPAADIAIVGQDLRSIEKVTGRLGWAQAAWGGALNGALLGLLFGAIVILWTPQVEIAAFAGVLLVGVAIGMVFRLFTYALLRRRRDFASVMQLTAAAYDVTVLTSSAAKAREVLGAGRPAVKREPVNLDEPPRYGVRVMPDAPVHEKPESTPHENPQAPVGDEVRS